MGTELGGLSNTVHFLQEENQRLQQANQELEDENTSLRDALKSILALQRAVSDLDTRVTVQPLLDRIIYEALRIVDAADGSLSLVDEKTQEVVFVVVRGALQEQLRGYRMPPGTGIIGWAVAHQEPVIANDIGQDPRFSPLVDTEFQFRTQSLICVPLIARGKTWGAIEVVNKFSGRPFEERDLEMLSMLAPIAATAIYLASLEAAEAPL
jgi:GAF domain-containing protein